MGFDIAKIPWSVERFAEDKAFLLSVIDAASARSGWEVLDYAPREDWVTATLGELRVLIYAFSAAHIVADDERSWWHGKPQTFTVCEAHGVHLHVCGCVICND